MSRPCIQQLHACSYRTERCYFLPKRLGWERPGYEWRSLHSENSCRFLCSVTVLTALGAASAGGSVWEAWFWWQCARLGCWVHQLIAVCPMEAAPSACPSCCCLKSNMPKQGQCPSCFQDHYSWKMQDNCPVYQAMISDDCNQNLCQNLQTSCNNNYMSTLGLLSKDSPFVVWISLYYGLEPIINSSYGARSQLSKSNLERKSPLGSLPSPVPLTAGLINPTHQVGLISEKRLRPPPTGLGHLFMLPTHWSTLTLLSIQTPQNHFLWLIEKIKSKVIETLKGKRKPQVRKMENLFCSHSIKLLIFSQDSAEDFAWYLPGVTWDSLSRLFTRRWLMMSQKVTTQEGCSLWLWPTFLKMDSKEWVSFKCLEEKVTYLIIATQRIRERETSWAEAEGEVWIKTKEKVVKQWNIKLKTQNKSNKHL